MLGDSSNYKSQWGWYCLINFGIIIISGVIIYYLWAEAWRHYYSQLTPPTIIDHFGLGGLIIFVPLGVVLIIVGLYMRQDVRTEPTKLEPQ